MAERRTQRLAMLLHNEFCHNEGCNGVVDYMDAATRLLPKIDEFIINP